MGENSIKILVCEDNDPLVKLIRFKLSRAGYKDCVIARDGREAKQLLTDNDFDLIISDIHMPFISGLELTTFIRKELGRETPIIILSAEGVEDTVLQSFDLGANDFITKPFSPQELVMRVKKLTS